MRDDDRLRAPTHCRPKCMAVMDCLIDRKKLLYLAACFARAIANLIALSSYKSQFKPSANQPQVEHSNLTVVGSSIQS